MNAYQWLIVYLINETEDRRNQVLSSGGDRFTARNDSQVYRASLLSKVFGEYTALRYYWTKLSSASLEFSQALQNLGVLYGLSCLDKHLVYFYQGGYARTPDMSKQVKESILNLCRDLKPDSLSVIDAIAPPDYVVNSVLGKSDGRVSIRNSNFYFTCNLRLVSHKVPFYSL